MMGGIPQTLRIGAFDIEILVMGAGEVQARGEHGSFSTAEGVIRIAADHVGPANAIDTLLHEVGHAIWWAYMLQDDDKQERIVGLTATAWTQIYRDNPELLAWIAETLHPDEEGPGYEGVTLNVMPFEMVQRMERGR